MRNILLFISVLLALGVANSCISEKVTEEIVIPDPAPDPIPDPDPTPDPTPNKIFRLSASVEAPLYKQSLGAEKIGVFIYKSRVDSIFSNRSLTLAANGYGEYDIVNDADSVGYCFGYYPYLSSISETIYSGSISSTQDQTPTTTDLVANLPSSVAAQLLMISDRSNEIKFANETANIKFKSPMSLFRFKITKDVSNIHFNNQRVKKFEMYMSSALDTLTPFNSFYRLSGDYTVDVKKAAESSSLKLDFPQSTSSARISANITNSQIIGAQPMYIWIAVPPFVPYANKLVVRMETVDEDGISFETFSTFSGFEEIKENSVKDFDVHLMLSNVYSDALYQEPFSPANSIIISEPGLYQILTKKPSGTPITGGRSATWLWASKANGGNTFGIESLIDNVEYSADTIKFRVLGGATNKGNVVLALKDNTGNILWTWHLWITDTPQDINTGSDYFLDRNLGATSAGREYDNGFNSYGFVYQWGRKDPFIGGGNGVFKETVYMSVANANTIKNGTSWDKTTYGDVTVATRFPMRFINSTKTGELKDDLANPADWHSTGVNNFWSDTQKTDYDPCPYGYKVPARSKLSVFHRVDSTSMWFVRRSDLNYWQLYRYRNEPAVMVVPAAGMRQGRDDSGKGPLLNYSGTSTQAGNCFYWTSTPVNLSGINPGGSHRIYTNGNTIYGEIEYGDNADAYPVRCVKYTP